MNGYEQLRQAQARAEQQVTESYRRRPDIGPTGSRELDYQLNYWRNRHMGEERAAGRGKPYDPGPMMWTYGDSGARGGTPSYVPVASRSPEMRARSLISWLDREGRGPQYVDWVTGRLMGTPEGGGNWWNQLITAAYQGTPPPRPRLGGSLAAALQRQDRERTKFFGEPVAHEVAGLMDAAAGG